MMDKMDGMSMDLTATNIEKLKELFPNAVTEGKIDFDMLRTMLGDEIDTSKEKYQFTWNGKAESIKLAQTPSSATLRPCKEKSKDWDTTENLYIEGDNLEVLKQLQKSYFGRIKIIYIDPPYNTGNDFVYKDNFKDSIENYKEQTSQKASSNPETSGRFHSDWLNMMYPRLILARNLLTDDGVLFVSIDDNEVENLKKICSEIFGMNNFVAQLVWEKKKKGAFLNKKYINMKEYVLVFSKNYNAFSGLIGEITSAKETYPCIKTTNARGIRVIRKGTRSKFKESDYSIAAGTRISSGNMELIYLDEMSIKDGVLQNDVRIDSNWIYGQTALDGFSDKGLIYITQDNYIRRIVDEERVKMLKDILFRVGADGESLTSYKFDKNLNNGGWGTNEDANDELHKLLDHQYLFDYSKPTRLISKLIQAVDDKDCIVLDFFSGSGTTADAVMRINAADGGRRKYVMVQLPEIIEVDSSARSAGYNNICEIGEKRIIRAGAIVEEQSVVKKTQGSKLDTGFKVFKLDSTNINQWDNTMELDEQTLFDTLSVFKQGRSKEDVLYEIMLKYGVFDQQASVVEINGKTMYRVGQRYMLVCLEDKIDNNDITEICKLGPRVVVFKEDGFKDDNAKINAEYNLKNSGVEDVKCI